MMRWLGLFLLAALGSFACGESRLIDDFTEQATRLRITPEIFRGSVPCTNEATAGALQTYAVRFQQVRESPLVPDAGLFDALSPAVPCQRSVVLDAVPGRLYAIQVYGFDRALSGTELPLEEARWTAECGRGEPDGPLAPTRAIYGAMVPITGCSTFSGESGSNGTRLVVDQPSALGNLRCGSQPGQVLRLEGLLDGLRVSARCGEPLAFELANVAGFHTIDLTAFEATPQAAPTTPPGSPTTPGNDPLDASVPVLADAASDATAPVAPADAGVSPSPQPEDAGTDAGVDLGVARWSSQCSGRALPGVSALASCEPLQRLP
jgi:hypothetical protein